MIQRGRRSTARPQVLPTSQTERPEPLPWLNEAEAAEWRLIVNRMPPDWFPPESQSILEALCVLTVEFRAIRQEREAVDNDPDIPTPQAIELCELLSKKRERSAKVMAMLATKLRLTPQSRYDSMKASSAARNAAPGDLQPWDRAA